MIGTVLTRQIRIARKNQELWHRLVLAARDSLTAERTNEPIRHNASRGARAFEPGRENRKDGTEQVLTKLRQYYFLLNFLHPIEVN